MKRVLTHTITVLSSIALILTTLLFLNAGGNSGSSDGLPDIKPFTGRTYSSPFIPEKMDFASEQVPLEMNELFERIDHEFVINSYWHSNTILNMKRSARYFADISKWLKEEGVPDDFKYLAVAESGLTNATSPAGAKGFWQFMESTAKQYGLEVNRDVDERYNLELSTRAACRLLKDARESTRSWTLAAASYNRGVNGILRALKAQSVENYYDLYLNRETYRYVPRLVAIKYIYSYPEKYGFNLSTDDSYQAIPVKRIEVTRTIPDLVKFAKDNGTNYKHLKLHNPWLLSDHLPNRSGKRYTILIPK